MNNFLLKEQPGRTAKVKGKEYLFFSGYAYLGMNHVAAFTELVKEGMDKYGLLFPSSRISNTGLYLFEEFENLLSKITGSEETVCFSSGFVAGRSAASLFKKIEIAPGSHPAISKNKIADTSFDKWKNDFIKKVNLSEKQSQQVFAADSVNILTATVNNFSFLKSAEKNITAIIDDSHGIRLIGENGRGISSLITQKKNLQYIFTYSLSKAFGLIGGAVSCNKKQAAQLRNLHEYTSSTSVSPAFMYAFIHAQQLYARQRKKLQQNCLCFQDLIKNISSIKFHPSLPVFILPENIDENIFADNNIIISSFAYPNPSGKKIQRIILNALHTKEDLERLSTCLQKMMLL